MRRLGLSAIGCVLVATSCSPGQESTGAMTIDPKDPVVHITAHQWAYVPSTITLKQGIPVTLEITSEDVHHGFTLPDFGIRVDVLPDAPARVRVVPDKKGTFTFLCDVYCGMGHEDMSAQLVVE